MYITGSVPPFKPGKGHKFSHVLFDSRLSVHSRREVENFSSIAFGTASETIATYMAFRAGIIGQQRKAFDFFVFKSSRSEYYSQKCMKEKYFFCLGKNVCEVLQYTALYFVKTKRTKRTNTRTPRRRRSECLWMMPSISPLIIIYLQKNTALLMCTISHINTK